jgi:hypothetical protein
MLLIVPLLLGSVYLLEPLPDRRFAAITEKNNHGGLQSHLFSI